MRNRGGAGGPGFEPGTKVPKTLVIPFHHPPTESTDPAGALMRGWCLPSPEEVYQRSCRSETDYAPGTRGDVCRQAGQATGMLLEAQRVFDPGEKGALTIAARHVGIE